MIRLLRPFMLVFLVACTPRGERPDSIPAPAASGYATRGPVSVVGSAPMNIQVVLREPDGRNVRLVGVLEPELRRLSGIEVAVQGAVSPTPDPIVQRQIDVADYEIISVDGRPVVMGEVIAVEGGRARIRTKGGEEVLLSSAPSEFRPGQKVWVQGPSSMVVQTYGVIRQ